MLFWAFPWPQPGAAAQACDLPLYQHLGGINARIMPVPMMNIINGGAHAANNLDIQEFMILPFGAGSFLEAVRMGAETFHHLKKILKKNGLSVGVGDEGGFAPDLQSNEQAIEYIISAIEAAGYRSGRDIGIGLDAAASEFYKDGKYHFLSEGRDLSADELMDYYETLIEKYPLFSIEDGLAEGDWDAWERMTERMGGPDPDCGRRHFCHQPGYFQERH